MPAARPRCQCSRRISSAAVFGRGGSTGPSGAGAKAKRGTSRSSPGSQPVLAPETGAVTGRAADRRRHRPGRRRRRRPGGERREARVAPEGREAGILEPGADVGAEVGGAAERVEGGAGVAADQRELGLHQRHRRGLGVGRGQRRDERRGGGGVAGLDERRGGAAGLGDRRHGEERRLGARVAGLDERGRLRARRRRRLGRRGGGDEDQRQERRGAGSSHVGSFLGFVPFIAGIGGGESPGRASLPGCPPRCPNRPGSARRGKATSTPIA